LGPRTSYFELLGDIADLAAMESHPLVSFETLGESNLIAKLRLWLHLDKKPKT